MEPGSLTPDFQGDANAERLVIPQHRDLHRLPWFVGAKHVGEILEVLNLLSGKPDQYVARPETGLGRRAVGPDVGEADAPYLLAHVGDGAEVGPVAGAACSGLPGRRRGIDFSEKRAGLRPIQPRRNAVDQIQDLDRAGCVDLVPIITRPVVIRMQAGEEEQYGDIFYVERNVIAAARSCS